MVKLVDDYESYVKMYKYSIEIVHLLDSKVTTMSRSDKYYFTLSILSTNTGFDWNARMNKETTLKFFLRTDTRRENRFLFVRVKQDSRTFNRVGSCCVFVKTDLLVRTDLLVQQAFTTP